MAQVACSSAESTPEPVSGTALLAEPDCPQVEDYIRARAMNIYRAGGGLAAAPEARIVALPSYSASHGQQVIDGSSRYALAHGRVVELDADGSVVRSVDVPGRSQRLVALGSTVLVVAETEGVLPWRGRGPDEGAIPCETLGRAGDGRGTFGADSELRSLRGPVTRITVVDMVTGATHRTLAYEGRFVALRRVGSVVTVISEGELFFPPAEGFVDEDAYWAAVTQQFLHEWLPRRIDTRGADSLTDQVARCEDHVLAPEVAGGGFLIGLSVDLANPAGGTANRVALGLGHRAAVGDLGVYTAYPAAWDPAVPGEDQTIVHGLRFTEQGLMPMRSQTVDGVVSPHALVEIDGHLLAATPTEDGTTVHAFAVGEDGLSPAGTTTLPGRYESAVRLGDQILWAGETLMATTAEPAPTAVGPIPATLPAAVGDIDGVVTVSRTPSADSVQLVRWSATGTPLLTWTGAAPTGGELDDAEAHVTSTEAMIPWSCPSGSAGWLHLDPSGGQFVPAPTAPVGPWCGPTPGALVDGTSIQAVGPDALVPLPADAPSTLTCSP